MHKLLLKLYSSPLDLNKLAKSAQNHVKDALKNTNNFTSMSEMINCLDGISDKLCIVTDSSECIRRLHPDRKWRRLADAAFNSTNNLMNELNSDKKLIETFLEMEKTWTSGQDWEMDAVIKEFKRDFELFYNLNEQERTEVSKLQSLTDESAIEFEKIQSIESLEKLIRARFQLSKALGFKSPVEMCLRDKQLKSSSEVMSFLNSKLLEHQNNSPRKVYRFSFTNIKKIIDALIGLCEGFFKVIVEMKASSDLAGMQSFSLLFYEESNKFVGEILFDLTPRRFKDPHPTHYTIKCRKQNTPALILISHSINDLSRISWTQSQSLFHEFGHALHSVLSRTKFQMLSGTRCALDLAEIPSSLFEFIHDEREMQSALSADKQQQSVSNEMIVTEELFQLQISVLDQLLHSIEPGPSNWTRDLVNQTEIDFKNSFNFKPREADWHCKVQHFASYGGSYYAYSFSKSVAEKIWKAKAELFDLFKKEFLYKGGTATIDFIKQQYY